MSLYLLIELCSLAVPLIFSFDKKVAYYKHWKYLFPAMLISAVFFIATDIWFTDLGVWGFNPRYHSSLLLAGLPVEEILFFFIIPYCSIFIHYVFITYFPNAILGDKTTRIVSIVIIMILSLITITNINRAYTAFFSIYLILLMAVTLLTGSTVLNRFFISFLIILIPFFAVNGILTGSFIEEEVVWYNSMEITGVRIFTVPAEDTIYGFSMILSTLLLMDIFEKYFSSKKKI